MAMAMALAMAMAMAVVIVMALVMPMMVLVLVLGLVLAIVALSMALALALAMAMVMDLAPKRNYDQLRKPLLDPPLDSHDPVRVAHRRAVDRCPVPPVPTPPGVAGDAAVEGDGVFTRVFAQAG